MAEIIIGSDQPTGLVLNERKAISPLLIGMFTDCRCNSAPILK
ncbi:hypothetical protein SAMN03159290_01498 [Pseudomonas sp. NFACC13-1]|nr:hypothetical protein SAMN03159290_01498 [Pseudomonas sp. NFACC13-1]